MAKIVKEIHAVIQRHPGGFWWAGFGYIARDGEAVTAGGNYLAEIHETKKGARNAALAIARGYRNTVLTLGGCTRETLPPIKFKEVKR